PPADPLPLHRLHVAPPQVPPFAMGSFDAFGPDARAGYPHRHTFYEVVYVTGGAGAHVIDLVRRPLQLHLPHLCVILPGQVHYWGRVSGLRGELMLFGEDFLLSHPGDRELLHALGERQCLRLPAARSGEGDDAAGIGSLVRAMSAEYAAKAEGYASVLEAYLHILLVRALRLPGVRRPAAAAAEAGTGAGAGTAAGRAADVAKEFGLLLTATAGAEGPVGAYAARVGVSVGYLNEAVKQATGRTPGELLRAARTLEAKRLLTGTALGVGQVARRVGFADPAYFCRFFRRETGVSPGDFRRRAAARPGSSGNHHVHRTESIAPHGSPP
ncbi:helix-turn-helix domain-containing protein, partial [Streptomyces sp. URMC 127]|uniref:helix-turn-helix domain-containing protein n=1 Tax=Streptomyces sp. URMC 127 TaxID=3423402 RepID=UPI003F1D263D